jgi:hypothetical protein
MDDLTKWQHQRLEYELTDYGFLDGKYGSMPYDAVRWVGATDDIDFGFNVFVDNRLIATAVLFKSGKFTVAMYLAQWLKGSSTKSAFDMDADYRSAVARRAIAVTSRRTTI